MSDIEVILLALALAADAFSVGGAVGISHGQPRQIFRLSWHFGLFQSLLALMGYLMGSLLMEYLGSWDNWIAGGILCLLGVRMIIGALGSGNDDRDWDLTRGWSLMGLSVAVSIDALAAGIGLAAVTVSAVFAITIIGVVSALATLISMLLAGRIGKVFGHGCEIAAGGVLICLGIRFICF